MIPPLLSATELRTILSRGEGQFVELKSAWDRGVAPPKPRWRRALWDKIADVVAAFANADKGLLLVGVDDEGAATGHGSPDEHVDERFAVPHRRLTPAVDCRTERLLLWMTRGPRVRGPDHPEAVMIDSGSGRMRPLRAWIWIWRNRMSRAGRDLPGQGIGRCHGHPA